MERLKMELLAKQARLATKDPQIDADIEVGRQWALAHATIEDLEAAEHISRGHYYHDDRLYPRAPQGDLWKWGRWITGVCQVYVHLKKEMGLFKGETVWPRKEAAV